MKETFNYRYKQVCQMADEYGDAFTGVASESIDDLDSISEFVDTMFYMHTITDDEHQDWHPAPYWLDSPWLVSM